MLSLVFLLLTRYLLFLLSLLKCCLTKLLSTFFIGTIFNGRYCSLQLHFNIIILIMIMTICIFIFIYYYLLKFVFDVQLILKLNCFCYTVIEIRRSSCILSYRHIFHFLNNNCLLILKHYFLLLYL